jgi:hypothetical protein
MDGLKIDSVKAASKGVADLFAMLTDSDPVDEVLLKFVRQLEEDGAKDHRISLFVFALRSFYCWPRATELCGKEEVIKRIRGIWIQQNHMIYEEWLTSNRDSPDALTWEKWTFQAKNSILQEFLDSNVCASVRHQSGAS